jgi:hypothetical protein
MIEIGIPGSIRVGGLDYQIECSEEASKELRSNGNWGEHNGWLQRIRLRKELSSQAQSQVFLHEIIHAISDIYLNGKLNDDDMVDPLAQGLTQVFEELGVRFVLA